MGPWQKKKLDLVYESPRTVVLNGETLIFGGGGQPLDPENLPDLETLGNYPNSFLWMAVDGFKAQGYQIDCIMVGGQGSRGNPHEFVVVMSK